MKIWNFINRYLLLDYYKDFSFKGAKKRQREGLWGLFLYSIPLIFLVLGKTKLLLLSSGLISMIVGLIFGYFGVIKKDLNNKYVNMLGGYTRCWGIPKTTQIAVKNGYINFVLAITFSLFFFFIASMV